MVGNDATNPRPVSRGPNLQVGYVGLDSLYLVIEYSHADLYRAWAEVVRGVDSAELRGGVPYGSVLIRSGAHGYPLSVWEGDARLYMTERVTEELRGTSQEGQGMGALLQLGPQTLRTLGEVWEPKRLCEGVLAQLAAFGVKHVELYPMRINRADLTVDVIGLDLATLPVESWHDRWVGASRPRAIYYASDSGQVEGFTVGTSAGDVMFRLYDKVFESGQKGRLDFWRSVWGMAEADERPVTRFEWAVKCYQAGFGGLGYLPDLTFERFCGLLNYVTQSWGRLCQPDPDDSNRSRWALDPLWAALLEMIAEWSFHYDETAAREYVFTPDLSSEYLMQLTGWLAGFMARVGIRLDKSGPVSLARALAFLHERGYTLADLDQKAQEKWEVMARLLVRGGWS